MRFYFPQRAFARSRSGVTLIEVLLYFVISAIVLAVLFQTLFWFMQSRWKFRNMEEGLYSIRYTTQYIGTAVRSAQSVDTGSTVFDSDFSYLSLTMINPEENTTDFFLSGSTLFVQKGTDTPSPLTPSTLAVTQFTVRNVSGSPSPNTLQFTVAGIQSTTGSAIYTATGFTLTTAASLRSL